MSPKLLIWVQNLLGSGHLKRQLLIADASIKADLEVMLVSGGPPSHNALPAGVGWHQLPPLRSRDLTFSALVNAQGELASDPDWTARQASLRQITEQFRPDIIMTEMFPFGRRKFRDELLSWFDHLAPKPKLACSVRDILVSPKKLSRVQESANIIQNYFDRVFVHSDPSVQTIDDSFALADDIRDRIAYTGYVVDHAIERTEAKTLSVTISAGSGIVGRTLIDAAIACHQQIGPSDLPWLVVTGSSADPNDFSRWQDQASPTLRIERFRHDLPQCIASSRLSISQAGYNTVAETLQAGTPMILVPFETATEDEQIRRARRIETLGRGLVLREADLSPRALVGMIERGLGMKLPAIDVNLEGASRTAQSLKTMIK